jgi:hypothetical protein
MGIVVPDGTFRFREGYPRVAELTAARTGDSVMTTQNSYRLFLEVEVHSVSGFDRNKGKSPGVIITTISINPLTVIPTKIQTFNAAGESPPESMEVCDVRKADDPGKKPLDRTTSDWTGN